MISQISNLDYTRQDMSDGSSEGNSSDFSDDELDDDEYYS